MNTSIDLRHRCISLPRDGVEKEAFMARTERCGHGRRHQADVEGTIKGSFCYCCGFHLASVLEMAGTHTIYLYIFTLQSFIYHVSPAQITMSIYRSVMTCVRTRLLCSYCV